MRLPRGPRRTAAVGAWFQGLYEETSEPPILVGGAAVELYTSGAYVTGDMDFVGDVPPSVARYLEANGFVKQGRHWVNESAQLFLELPGRTLEPKEPPVRVVLQGYRLVVISPEALLADRLASWKLWRSETDAVNALLLIQSSSLRLRPRVLARLTRELEVDDERRRLTRFARRLRGRPPSDEEMTQWLRARPK